MVGGVRFALSPETTFNVMILKRGVSNSYMVGRQVDLKTAHSRETPSEFMGVKLDIPNRYMDRWRAGDFRNRALA